MTKTIIITSAITALVVSLIVVVLFGSSSIRLGAGTVENYPVIFSNGIRAGTNASYIADANGYINGSVSSTKAMYFYGTSTFSGAVSGISTSSLTTLSVSGTTTLAGASTLQCGKIYNGTATTTAYYFSVIATASSSGSYYVLATTTKPSLCP